MLPPSPTDAVALSDTDVTVERRFVADRREVMLLLPGSAAIASKPPPLIAPQRHDDRLAGIGDHVVAGRPARM